MDGAGYRRAGRWGQKAVVWTPSTTTTRDGAAA